MLRRLAIVAAVAWPALAGAVLPHEQLADPALEARARALSKELRCQVCQNQSIDDSYAPLAADLRRLVRERLAAGDSDAQILAFVTSRYGDYVRLTPPMRLDTILLWSAPALCLVAGAVGLLLWSRRRPPTIGTPLDAEEERALAALLARDKRERDPG
ncbi:MAG: cytochrome c-type biogenesis protein CcmH [Alphaproteobacteria bacterium]|nr:cytochrome c-type biogenesis protein CcmH [Alphaproteobacteria bacterium]